jgi:hypothetical protein
MDQARSLLKAANRVLRLATAYGGSSDDEVAVRDGLGHGLEFFGAGEQRLRADGGMRFTESQFVRVHHAKMRESEVAHRTSGGADVQRIARLDEDDAQVVEFGRWRQGSEFTAEKKTMK